MLRCYSADSDILAIYVIIALQRALSNGSMETPTTAETVSRINDNLNVRLS